MDLHLLNQLLLWLHLIALAMGGAATFGIPVVGARMPTATTETRPVLFGIVKGLSGVSRAALVVLIITGPLLAWLKYGGFGGLSIWFWIKMVLVAVLLGGVIFGGILLKRASGGDMAAAKMQPKLGAAMLLVMLGVILTAVLAFD